MHISKSFIQRILVLKSAVVDVRRAIAHGRIAGGVEKLGHRSGIGIGSWSGNSHGNGQEGGEQEKYL